MVSHGFWWFLIVFNGVLIARGDLGVEMSLSKLPVLQKKIIKKCRLEKKPVIIATQMLESMINNITPTRAEVNDVANSVIDGADATRFTNRFGQILYNLDGIT